MKSLKNLPYKLVILIVVLILAFILPEAARQPSTDYDANVTVYVSLDDSVTRVGNALVTLTEKYNPGNALSAVTDDSGKAVIYGVPVGIDDKPKIELPDGFSLEQNNPNPWNPSTKFKYSILEKGHVRVFITDLKGDRTKTLVDRVLEPGSYETVWGGENDAGRDASEGVYIYSLEHDGKIISKKMTKLGDGSGSSSNSRVGEPVFSKAVGKKVEAAGGKPYKLEILPTDSISHQINSNSSNIEVSQDIELSTYVESILKHFKGNLYDIMSKQNMPGFVKLGNLFVPTDSLGNFDFFAEQFDEDTLKAQGYTADSIRTSFQRRKLVGGNQHNLDMRVKVAPLLPDSVGLSDTTVYWFALEANFSGNPFGLKKIDFENAQHPDSGFVYWICLYNPVTQDTFLVEEQNNIRDYLEQFVLASIPDDKRPNIYIATVEDTIPRIPGYLKPNKYGYCIICPRRGVTPGFISYDDDRDGILERAVIFLPNGYIQGNAVQEGLSWLIAPYQVGVTSDIPNDKTVLHGNSSVEVKQPADYLLEAVALEFPAKTTQIDDILGLGRLSGNR